MISENNGEFLRNVLTLNANTSLIRRIRKFDNYEARSFITEETFDKNFKIVVIKNGEEMPYLVTKHMSSILDSIGLHVMHILIARDVLDQVYEHSWLKEEKGVATWTPEELTELTIKTLEEIVEEGNENISYDEVIDYSQTHRRLEDRKENC